MVFLSLLAFLLLAASGLARDVPDNVRELYDSIRKKGKCSHKLATGFWSDDNGSNSFSYCGDHLDDYNIVYIQGTRGALANMDVDCDGAQGGQADDGRCASSNDTQYVSSFQDTVESYRQGIKDLNANIHPYIVFGNEGSKRGWATFDPREHGIEPLSIMAVVCGDKLIYGVWGDTNGDDGPRPMVGEAAISVATACFGSGVSGDNGYDDDDVLYIAFTGQDAVPGSQGANWSATNYEIFEKSIQDQGDTLIERIGSTGARFAVPVGSLWRGSMIPLLVSLIFTTSLT
ncbi:Glycoside hydrolase family 75 [Scedosporium apiospermum]|uniref:Endo-chitosanase n=1 Tax=Pseudallescheria apiosperma TaxID=563466 RepID=A0A084G0N4_PSEDA|nr:Glycoside hydrolase family 75 [Scedosporium apiospermum]KEZ40896.1 Glycoside hydrolase family 75 [Scedosporium apiospermum]